MNEEFWKQFVGSIARKLLAVLAGILIAKLGVSQEIAGLITSDQTVAAVAGILLLVLGIVWAYAKTKFQINFVNTAHESMPSAYMGDVKQDAKKQSAFQTSI